MISDEIKEKIKRDEYNGERLVNRFRLALSFIFLASVLAVSIIRNADGLGFFPLRAYSFTSIFFLYSVFLFFYIRKKETLHDAFKYICVVLDMTIISAAIWTGCTYLEASPPLPFLSIQALFYIVLIMAGAFRYSVPCAYFSGIYAGICYLVVVFANAGALDLPYFFMFEGKIIPVSFPLYNEVFRVIAMTIAGLITGIACKRHLTLFNNMIESETAAAEAATNTVEQTRNMAKTIQKSTDEILISSRDISTTANEQSASVAEIVSTMENSKNLSSQAAAKTVEVAELADKTRELSSRGADLRDANESMMLDIRNQNAKIIDVIRNLADILSSIDESVQLIDTIADNTKLIAFNAALEASSSGEAGLRFAVVAAEIRRFADNVVESVVEIKEKIAELQDVSQELITEANNGSRTIDSGYTRMVEQKEVFENIVDSSQNVAVRSQQISSLSKQQELASAQIFIALKEISAGVNQFVTATSMTSATVDKLNSMSVELKETLAKYQTKNRGNT